MPPADHAPCPACGIPHGPEARYCIACGTLVGRRSIDLDRAFAAEREQQAGEAGEAAVAVGPDDGTVVRPGVWRRPAASILITAALAAGVLGGFLLGPDGGVAQRAPLLLGGLGAAAQTATTKTPDDTATTDAPPAVEGDADLSAVTGDDTTTPSEPDSGSDDLGGDGGTDLSGAAEGDDATGDDTAGDGDTDLGGLATTAGVLPPIEHVWVIGVNGQDFPALFGTPRGYLSDALASRGTVLSAYAPAPGGPLAGATTLLSGAEPAAADVPTLLGQLTEKTKPWRAYVEGHGDTGCAAPGTPFALTTIAASPVCATSIADLSQLSTDLLAQDTIPAFSYILPDPSRDGSGATGTTALDALLEQVIAPIRRTKAYKSSGLIAILPASGAPGSTAPTGALLLSPFVAHGKSIDATLGPYALLRTFEDVFSLDHLGHAADASVASLGAAVFRRPASSGAVSRRLR
jgi:hypothetical protein